MDYQHLWDSKHPFEYGNIIGVPSKISYVHVHTDIGKVKTRTFLRIEVNDVLLFFLLNPDNNPPITTDLNADVREFGFGENQQIATGNQSNTCIQLKFGKDWFGEESCKVTFIKSEKFCRLFSFKKCKVLDTLMFCIFKLCDHENFNGVVLLDDNMRYNGESVILYRIRKGIEPPSKYSEFGFQIKDSSIHELQRIKTIVENEKDENKTSEANMIAVLDSITSNMYNSSWKTNSELLGKKLKLCNCEVEENC